MLKLGLSESALQERRAGIGGSDCFTVVHGAPEERYQLWLEKTGQKKPKKIMSDWNYALRHVTETLQLDWYEHVNPGEEVVYRGHMLWSKAHRWMFATFDGVIRIDPKGKTPFGCTPIDCKHVSRWTKEAREWCIEHYTAQMTHQAIILDADYALLSLLHGEKEPEIIRIDVDPFYREDLIEREREFWTCCAEGVPPPDCAHLDIPKVATPVKKRRDIDLNGGTWAPDGQTLIADTRWPNWAMPIIEEMGKFERTHGAAIVHALARDSIKKLVPEDAGVIVRGQVEVKQDGRGITIALKEKADG